MSAVAIGAGLGAVTSIFNRKANRKKQEKQIKLFWKASLSKFATTQDASNIMKGAARRSAADAIGEVKREGGAKGRETELLISKEISKSIATSEGLTSGISKGKQAIALEIKATKVMEEVKDQTQSQVNKILDAKDKVQNDMNNKLFAAHNELKGALAQNIAKETLLGNVLGAVSGAVGGAQTGASLASTFGGASTAASTGASISNMNASLNDIDFNADFGKEPSFKI